MKGVVKVYIRVKPDPKNTIWVEREGKLYQKLNKDELLIHKCFKKVYTDIDNKTLYDESVRNSILEFLTNMKKCTIFCYGQTGSGKTYTMMGPANRTNYNSKYNDGIIFQSLKQIFTSKTPNQKVKVSYLEIYNENLFDLLNTNNKPGFFNKDSELLIQNLEEKPVDDLNSAINLVFSAEQNRKIGKTEFNERSSRSHTVLQIIIEENDKKAWLNLIDLAGSEKASIDSERRKESAFINKSLLALGSMVTNLENNKPFKNYRDSKLTRFLQTSLKGDADVLCFCSLNPSELNLAESFSTLNFASRLSNIKMSYKKEKMIDFNIETKTGCGCKIEKGIKKEKTLIVGKLKLESEVLKRRINNLELILEKVIEQVPNSNLKEIYTIEKNLFEIELGKLKGEYNFLNDVFEL